MNKQIIVLLFVVFFGFLGAAMPYPIFSPLFLNPENNGFIPPQYSLTTRGIFLGITLAAYPFGQFIGSPILGSLSDQLGRKKLLFISMLGTGLCYIISGLSIHYGLVWILILSRLLTGFLEGNLAIAQASIADMSISKHKGFGAVSAMASMGYVFGPLLAGILSNNHLVSWFNFSLPFYAASCIAIITALNILLWTRETLKQPLIKSTSLLNQFNLIRRFTELSKNVDLKWLLIGGFFLCLSIDAYYEFFPALLVGRWNMSVFDISVYTVVLSIALTIGSYWIPSLLSRKYTNDFCMLLMILIFPLMYVFMLLTDNTYFLYLQFAIIGLSYGSACTFHTVLVSDNAPHHQQGEVMGMRWGLRMLGDALISIFGGLLIAFSINLPIILAIICAGLSFVLLYKRLTFYAPLSTSS